MKIVLDIERVHDYDIKIVYFNEYTHISIHIDIYRDDITQQHRQIAVLSQNRTSPKYNIKSWSEENMQTISVINQKGGVGKSTTALAIGAGLVLKGYRTLFFDLDAQGNLTYTLGATTQGYNDLGVLQKPERAKDEIQHTEQGDIIASSPALSGADTIITQTGKEYRLKEALETIAEEYDYCIIDTPPALGILTINALTACTGVIIPSQADIYSLQGISQLNNTIETVKKYCNPSLFIMGIVLTRFNKRSIIRREVAELLEKTAEQLNTKLYKTRIRECIALVEAQATKQSIYKYSPKSNATADYKALVNEILEEE